jgi:DNA-binding MarR family transcriptional regulator
MAKGGQMTANEPLAPILRSWRQIQQTYDVLKQCQDQVLKEYGLTVEQLSVLSVINYLGGSARITDIAGWVERSPNSVSMIVDRMVKAGLVRRKRDRGDRRVVYVSATGKGQAAFKPAYPALIELVRGIFRPLSEADMSTISGLLGALKYEILRCSNPDADRREIEKAESRKLADEERWISESGLLSGSQAKSQRKTRRIAARRAR